MKNSGDRKAPESYEGLETLLNFYLNVKANPKTDWRFILGGYSYLGSAAGCTPKLATPDIDGVLEKEGAYEFSKLFLIKLGKENQRIGRRMPEIAKYVKILQTPDGMVIGEKKLSRIFRECDLMEYEYEAACAETAKEFVRYNLIPGAIEYFRKSRRDMGYENALLGGPPDRGLEFLVELLNKYIGDERIGIPKENIAGTHFPFKDGRLAGDVEFLVGRRRVEKKNRLFEGKISTKYGCYFIFDNDPVLNAATLKSGLNPSVIIGEFSREKLRQLGLDVFTCCPEARDNLLNVIPPMNRFDYGWIVANIVPGDVRRKSFGFSIEQRKTFNRLEALDDAEAEFSYIKDRFASLSLQILDIKGKYKLLTEESEIRDEVWKLLTTKEDSKRKIKRIFEFFESNIPETEALEGVLYAV